MKSERFDIIEDISTRCWHLFSFAINICKAVTFKESSLPNCGDRRWNRYGSKSKTLCKITLTNDSGTLCNSNRSKV